MQQYIHTQGEGVQPKNHGDWGKNDLKFTENSPFDAKNDDFKPKTPRKPAESRSRGVGITPNKFILRDLKPLYTSIERTLGIFEKTGVCAEYTKEEDENYAHITIRIPK